MKTIITISKDDGAQTVICQHKCPYTRDDNIYYCYKNIFGRWVLRKTFVRSIWYTNILGIELDNGWKIIEAEFKYLFDDRQKAIEFCLEKNRQRQVKIHNKNLF